MQVVAVIMAGRQLDNRHAVVAGEQLGQRNSPARDPDHHVGRRLLPAINAAAEAKASCVRRQMRGARKRAVSPLCRCSWSSADLPCAGGESEKLLGENGVTVKPAAA
ncbi:hypothetical protein [Kibdelosporangium philippinense]|uniref:hypothetical protein n=1 Tax=Kibdelosporangium philippinense TaxID=211113 RepID=UPI00360D516C